MDSAEYITRINQLITESYRVIRRKISDITDESNNDEIAGFVKGVVALQTELYEEFNREVNK